MLLEHKMPREELLALWDTVEPKRQQACAQYLLRLAESAQQMKRQAKLHGWTESADSVTETIDAVLLAVALLTHRGDKEAK